MTPEYVPISKNRAANIQSAEEKAYCRIAALRRVTVRFLVKEDDTFSKVNDSTLRQIFRLLSNFHHVTIKETGYPTTREEYTGSFD